MRKVNVLVWDDEQIRQVFFNLVHNSCEAMKDGGRLEIVTEQLDVPLQLRL